MVRHKCPLELGYAGIKWDPEKVRSLDGPSVSSVEKKEETSHPSGISTDEPAIDEEVFLTERCLNAIRESFDSFEGCMSLETSKRFFRPNAHFRTTLGISCKEGVGKKKLNAIFNEFCSLMMAQIMTEENGSENMFAQRPCIWKCIANQILTLMVHRKEEMGETSMCSSGPSVFNEEIEKKIAILSEVLAEEKVQKWKDEVEFAKQLEETSKLSEKRLIAENEHLRGEIQSVRNEICLKVQEVAELDCQLDKQKRIGTAFREESERQKRFNDEISRQNRVYRIQLESAEKSMQGFLLQIRSNQKEVDELKTTLGSIQDDMEEKTTDEEIPSSEGRKVRGYRINFTYPSDNPRSGIPSDKEVDLFLTSKIPSLDTLKEKSCREYYHSIVTEALVKQAALEFFSNRGILPNHSFQKLRELQETSGVWIPKIFGVFYKITYNRVDLILRKVFLRDSPGIDSLSQFRFAEEHRNTLRERFRQRTFEIGPFGSAALRMALKESTTGEITEQISRRELDSIMSDVREETARAKREFDPDVEDED